MIYWEQCKLGEVFNFYYGVGNNNPSNGGQYPVFGAGGIQGGYTKYNAENSIIIGHMGDAGCVSWGEGKHFVTYNGTITKPKDDVFSAKFGYYLLLNMNLRKYRGGSGLPFLTYDMLTEMETKRPNSRFETQKIANYFSYLDHLITLHQSKSFGHILEVIVSCTLSWEQRKLGECFTERTESMPKGELISVTINGGIKRFSELGRHDNSNEDKSKYKKVCIGDIAYNSMRMWQGASGYSPYNGIVSPAYTVLLANDGVNSKCIAFQFKLPRMIHVFQINSQGITSDNWNLKFPTLSDISIYISRSIDEQGKIASLLESLDHLITLHQRKLEKLKIIKKSMLENLFPQNGEKTPKIRFSGFTEDWEQRKLGEVFIYLRNNTLSREELNDEDGFAQSIHYGDVLIKYGECLNVSKVLLPYVDNKNIVNKFKKFYIQNGDIIIADTA